MDIRGLDTLVFAVDDVEATATYLGDYGLTPAGAGRFEALDGSAIVIAHRDDPQLPRALASGNALRKTIYAVGDSATLDAIATELLKDREVRRLADGSIEAEDDLGFCLGFRVANRPALALSAEPNNAAGAPPQRAPNQLGVDTEARPVPRALSHIALFVPDTDQAEKFYVERLGFRCTDRLVGAGPFLQPAGTLEHHTLFLIKTPPHMQGIEHLAFHLGGPNEVFMAGTRFAAKGYQSFWGPGRHTMGSNWFWYFNSPLGCRFEYDADMDLHDDTWIPRELPAKADSTQVFLFQAREKWAPVGGPPPAGGQPRV